MNVLSFQAHSNYIWRIKQSPFNNLYVATSSHDSKVNIWNANTNWTLIRNYTGHSSYVYALEWINEETIASSGYDGTIQIWSISTGSIQRTINVGDYVRALKLLNNGFHLACGTENGTIQIYNINTGSLIFTLRGHLNWVNDLILINNSTMASSSHDSTVRILDLNTNTQQHILRGHANRVWGLKSLSFDILESASYQEIKLWNTTSGELINTLTRTGHKSYIFWSLDLMSDGQTLVSGSVDQTIKLWNWKTGECLNTINTGLNIWSLATIKSKIGFFFIHYTIIFHFLQFKKKFV